MSVPVPIVAAITLVLTSLAIGVMVALKGTPRTRIVGTVVRVGTGITAGEYDLREASSFETERMDRRGVLRLMVVSVAQLKVDAGERAAVAIRQPVARQS